MTADDAQYFDDLLGVRAVVCDAADSQPVSRPRMWWNNFGLDGDSEHLREAQLHIPELGFEAEG
eukprot:6435961-Heterocapsa_arctica.AAC.1